MNRRSFFVLAFGLLPTVALAGPLTCIPVLDHRPHKTASIPYSVGGAPTQDAPDLMLETWEYQEKTVVLCRWPEMSDAEASDVVWRHFGL